MFYRREMRTWAIGTARMSALKLVVKTAPAPETTTNQITLLVQTLDGQQSFVEIKDIIVQKNNQQF